MPRVAATIADVAREAGVSVSTASRVLRGVLQVLPATREKILAAAERLGYQPNPLARALRSGGASAIALLTSSVSLRSARLSHAVAELSHALARSSHQAVVLLQEDSDAVPAALDSLQGWCGAAAVDGALLGGTATLQSLGEGKLPVVVIEPGVPQELVPPSLATVSSDHAQAAELALTHLTELGHRNIAWIGSRLEESPHSLRREAFVGAMTSRGLKIRPEWILWTDGPAGGDGIALVLERAIDRAAGHLTAIVCASDALAFSVIETLRAARRPVPQEISVVGYADTPAGSPGSFTLTTVEHSGALLGQALARMLLERLEDPAQPPEHVLLPPVLRTGDSTAPMATSLRITGAPTLGDAPQPIPRSGGGASACRIPDGIYELEARHSGMLLEVPYCVHGAGGSLWQWSRNGENCQLWHIEHAGEGWHRIRNVRNWLYADADAAEPDVTPVIINTTNASAPDHQLWGFDQLPEEDSLFRILNRAKDLTLDVAHESPRENAHVIMFPWHGGPNQQWRLKRIPFLSGDYELVALHSSMALDIPGGSRAPGVVPCQQLRARTLGQRWRLIYRGDQLYTLQSKLSGLNLQVTGEPGRGTVLAPADPAAEAEQLWSFMLGDPALPSWIIRNRATGQILEIAHARHTAGATAHVGPSGEFATHQQWLIFDDCSY